MTFNKITIYRGKDYRIWLQSSNSFLYTHDLYVQDNEGMTMIVPMFPDLSVNGRHAIPSADKILESVRGAFEALRVQGGVPFHIVMSRMLQPEIAYRARSKPLWRSASL